MRLVGTGGSARTEITPQEFARKQYLRLHRGFVEERWYHVSLRPFAGKAFF